MSDSSSPVEARRGYELLMKQMLHGLNRDEVRELRSTGVVPVATADVGPCTDSRPVVQVPDSIRTDGSTHGIVVDQNGDPVILDTRTARRVFTGVLHAALASAEMLIDPADDDFLSDDDELVDGVDAEGDALEVDLEEQPTSDDEVSVWGVSFAVAGACQVRLRVSGLTPCPVTVIGATKSGQPFPGRRLRSRGGEAFVQLAAGEGSTAMHLPLSDAEDAEEDGHRMEVVATWRATPSQGMGEDGLLVHMSFQLGASTLSDDHVHDLTAATVSLDFEGSILRPLPTRRSQNVMFARVPRIAVGHHCAATWRLGPSAGTLALTAWPTWEEPRARHATPIPAVPTADDLTALMQGYRTHLNGLPWAELPPQVRDGNRLACETLLDSAEETLGWLIANSDRWRVFQDACRVIMGTPRLGPEGWTLQITNHRTWRPFQMLFFLGAAQSAAVDGHRDSDRVDVIAFPTGGGKTEAYLLLSAFLLLHMRRAAVLRNDRPKSQARVLMRYPLRLLAAQQLQRAAAMTGKLSIVVGEYKALGEAIYGSIPCYIGLWAGSSLTPNTIKQAKSSLATARRSSTGSGTPLVPLAECPLCGSPVTAEIRKKNGRETAVLMCAPDEPSGPPCYFRDKQRMWVRWVDEDLYAEPPEFLIATQDKLAIAPWVSEEVKQLFTTEMRLVIQDELHMLDDELGSLEGAFQPYLDQRTGPVKVIASSATTKNTNRQVRLLYNRQRTLLVPAPEMVDQHWYVSEPDQELIRTTVTGLMPSPRIGGLQARLLLLSAQLQAAQQLFRVAAAPGDSPGRDSLRRSVDALWTNLVYFGSRPLLRETAVLLRRDITRQVNSFRFTFNYPGTGRAQWFREHSVLEASSESETTVTEIIEALQQSIDFTPSDDAPSAPRVCLATSMIEVGIDVDRLGLMTFVGHPKETNSYIQAGGRIGRQADRPGLTYVLYRPFSLRDVSIYEDFLAYHQQRNDMVEPALLAPFAPGALRRILPSLAVLDYAENSDPSLPLTSERAARLEESLHQMSSLLRDRFNGETDLSWLSSYVQTLTNVLYASAEQRGPMMPVAARTDLSSRSEPRGLLSPLERKPQLDLLGHPLYWFGPTSLRTVAGEVLAGITRPAFEVVGPVLDRPQDVPAPSPVATDGEEEA